MNQQEQDLLIEEETAERLDARDEWTELLATVQEALEDWWEHAPTAHELQQHCEAP